MANTSSLLISSNFMKFGNTSRDLNYKLQEEGKKKEHQIHNNKIENWCGHKWCWEDVAMKEQKRYKK